MNNKMASLEKLEALMNPVIRGWANYFSKFRASEARRVLDFVNLTLVTWIKRRFKSVRRSTGKAYRALARIAEANPHLFYHWRMGIRPTIG